MRALESRLAALEARFIEPTGPRKSLLPPWLMEECEMQGARFDVSSYPETGMESEPSTAAVRRHSACPA